MSHKAQRLRNQQSTAVTLHPNSYNLLCALEAKLFKLHSRDPRDSAQKREYFSQAIGSLLKEHSDFLGL